MSLLSQKNALSDSHRQLEILNNFSESKPNHSFQAKLNEAGLFPLKPAPTEILQINLGKMCNQTCKHCHVDAGPDRKEIMTRETMLLCLEAIRSSDVKTVDLTGGAPEMNPDFRWFVEEISKTGRETIVRCNLTIIVANPKYHDLPDFYASHKVHVISSLPYFAARKTDAQRGEGVFDRSIRALKMLNETGYGKDGSGLILDLVYNPSGAFLPAAQASLERDFKTKLKSGFDIDFNHLLTITNLPVSRFLDYLVNSGNYEAYMEKLVNSFNPSAAQNVMCRSTLSVGWDGYLYDCDFNQMLDLKVSPVSSQHIRDYNGIALSQREIITNQHCFGCTAGAGSSCGGATT